MNLTNLAYEDWAEDFGEELIGGELVAMAPAAANHVTVAGNIYRIFANFLRGKKCIAFPDGLIVHLTKNDRFVPDMMVICDRSKIKGDHVDGAPDLAVEVLSPSTARYDFGHKKTVYGRCGVKEYWIVDPNNRMIQQYLLEEGELRIHDVYTLCTESQLEIMGPKAREDAMRPSFRCSLFDDLEIRLDEVFDNIL